MKMRKKKFRIGELAQKLDVERFVIRFWEKEFDLTSPRSSGGQRFYDLDDVAIFTHIKQLLYDKGFTISGAKKQLQYLQKNNVATKISTHNNQLAQKTEWDGDIASQIGTLKKQLIKLRELL